MIQKETKIRESITPSWQSQLPPPAPWGGRNPSLLLFRLFAIAAVAWFSAGLLGAQTAPEQADLYQPDQVDLPDAQHPTPVRVAFQLQAIHDIDDEEETFVFSGVLTVVWKDGRQAFDPQAEGVTEKFYNGAFQFNELAPAWYPQVVLANATEFDGSQAVMLRVKPDGTSTLIQPVTAEVRSSLNLRRYPFDTQSLEAIFYVLGSDESEIVISADPDPATVVPSIFPVPQWDLMGVGVASGSIPSPHLGDGSKTSTLVLSLNMRRQPFFMVRLVLVPLILIVVLSWSVFWMDRSSLGDRMSVSFVGILTAVAYQIMVSDIMPQISYLTLMNAILSFSFLIMCATVAINLRVGVLDNRGDSERGERLDRCCRVAFPLALIGLLAIAFIAAFLWF